MQLELFEYLGDVPWDLVEHQRSPDGGKGIGELDEHSHARARQDIDPLERERDPQGRPWFIQGAELGAEPIDIVCPQVRYGDTNEMNALVNGDPRDLVTVPPGRRG